LYLKNSPEFFDIIKQIQNFLQRTAYLRYIADRGGNNLKAVVQKVIDASVSVDGVLKGSVSRGLLVYLGVAHNDTESDAERFSEKIAHLRIFNDDDDGKMNLSLKDLSSSDNHAGVLAVSQFTLLADTRKGRCPS
jgi:D-tyrosyl-tRNA(Tyr) deacylase